MFKFSHHNLAFIILSICFLSVKNIYSQESERIIIVQTDILRGGKKNVDPDLQKLIGNVILQHNFTLMYCDSAYFYQTKNIFEAFSNVTIKQGDSLTLDCDYVEYSGFTSVAKSRDNVVLKDKKMTLKTDFLDYNTETTTAFYYDGGNIISDETKLTSKRGNYYAESKDFYFKDSVVVTNPQYTIKADTLRYNTAADKVYFLGPTIITNDENMIYCEKGWYQTADSISQFEQNAFMKNDEQIIFGDLLYYNDNTQKGEGINNVKIHDFNRDVVVEGHKANFNREKEIYTISDSAVLTLITEDDSIFIHADTLKSQIDTSGTKRILTAYNKVKIYKTDLQGKCDSLVYLISDSTIQLHTDPVMWSGVNQMTAEYIEGYLKNNAFDRIWFDRSAFIISQEDADKYSQIKGKEMIGFFRNNQIYKIEVYGNGQLITFPKDEETGSFIGMNKVESSNLILYVENKEIKKVNFITKPSGNLTPLDQVEKESMKLKNFVWFEKHRPADKSAIFIWTD